MTGCKPFTVCGAALILASVPFATASADMLRSLYSIGAAQTVESLHGGHKARVGRRSSSGSYTNGKPDGANTGSRKQMPTRGNPGDGNHS